MADYGLDDGRNLDGRILEFTKFMVGPELYPPFTQMSSAIRSPEGLPAMAFDGWLEFT